MSPVVFVFLLTSCDLRSDEHDAGSGPQLDAGTDAGDGGGARWTGLVDVRVVDPVGAPVEGAFALVGGRPSEEWATTDSDGRATVLVREMLRSERWITAGKRGWYDGGVQLDDDRAPSGVVTVPIAPLPEEDNAAYSFREGGNEDRSDSPDQCMHCHETIGRLWNESRHHEALSNPHTRDLFNGSALSATEIECDALGGRWEESGVPGSETGALEAHCTVGRGVLPDLHDVCGREGGPPCDHPLLDREALTNFGSCGDCHGAAISGAVPGAIDLNAAVGTTYREGVSCDFCHKIDEVVVGPRPGLDGAIRLRRPSQPTEIGGLEYAPITFGPYPDVLNVFMGATYNPQFRDAGFCSACHEYAQSAVDPDDADLVDASKWPDGIPVHTTYSEWLASPLAPGVACQDCHMPVLHELSGSSDTNLELGGSAINGWLRPAGEVRRHDWPSVATLAPRVLRTEVALADDGDVVDATTTLWNLGAGHALPTGDPMRQVIVLVEATIDGLAVAPEGGQAVPDVGGSIVRGVVGADVVIAGRTVTFVGADLSRESPTAIRFVRPTGTWADYAGPGTGWFSEPDRTPEEKGLPVLEVLGEVSVESLDGDSVSLGSDPPPSLAPGDVAYLVGEGQWAGAPGWLYGKVLVDRDGDRAVHHYLAIDVASDDRIAATASGTISHRFPAPAPGSTLEVTARVVYRRQADAVARVYGWDREDVEIGRAVAAWSP